MQRQHPNKATDNFPADKTRGIIATVIFHIIIGAVLVFTGFHTPLPIPEEEGILVNFGYDNTGSGITEPMASAPSSASSSTRPDEEEQVPAQNTAEALPKQENDGEEIITQDFEEAPVIKERKTETDPEEERKKQAEIEAEKIRLQEIEAEKKRQEAEEAERKRLEEEKARLEEEARQREERRQNIFNRTRDALTRSEGAGTGTNKDQGIAGGEGNQGVESGTEGAQNYGPGGGTGNEGVSYDLAGRKAHSLPKPRYDIQKEGIVVVEVTVDRNGRVLNAEPGVKGSTTLEEYFLKVAKEAALSTRFNEKPDAPVIQKGTITYRFILR